MRERENKRYTEREREKTYLYQDRIQEDGLKESEYEDRETETEKQRQISVFFFRNLG